MIELKQTSAGLSFSVYVQPRASQTAIVGVHQKALKIKLTAPPVAGAANKQCIEVLAKALDMPKSAFKIISGQTNRLKQIRVMLPDAPLNQAQLNGLDKKLRALAQKAHQKTP